MLIPSLLLFLPLPQVETTGFRDLTESGTALEWRAAGGVAEIVLLEDPRVDPPTFSLAGVPGTAQKVLLALPEGDWFARAWSGPGEFRPLALVRSDDGRSTLIVDFQRSVEKIEIRLHGLHTQRASSYSYGELVNYLNAIPPDPRLTIEILGTSVLGRNLYKVVFDDKSAKVPAFMKRTVVMLNRQHGDEWPSSFVFEGTLDYLLGRNGWVPDPMVTDRVRFVMYPMINPDGAELDQRWNVNGVDLNRDWSDSGPAGWQQAETFTVQSDLVTLPFPNSIRAFGDHHGWYNSGIDGGFRYDDGGFPAGVTHAAYLEARKDTNRFTQYEPLVWDWSENPGQTGMSRVELYQWQGWLGHTPEYDRSTRSETTLRAIGANWARAMHDTVHGLTETAATVQLGQPAFFEADEDDENENSFSVETVEIIVADWLSGDRERLTLTETGANTGIFTSATGMPTGSGPMVRFDGLLQTSVGSFVIGYYADADQGNDVCYAGSKVVL